MQEMDIETIILFQRYGIQGYDFEKAPEKVEIEPLLPKMTKTTSEGS